MPGSNSQKGSDHGNLLSLAEILLGVVSAEGWSSSDVFDVAWCSNGSGSVLISRDTHETPKRNQKTHKRETRNTQKSHKRHPRDTQETPKRHKETQETHTRDTRDTQETHKRHTRDTQTTHKRDTRDAQKRHERHTRDIRPPPGRAGWALAGSPTVRADRPGFAWSFGHGLDFL